MLTRRWIHPRASCFVPRISPPLCRNHLRFSSSPVETQEQFFGKLAIYLDGTRSMFFQDPCTRWRSESCLLGRNEKTLDRFGWPRRLRTIGSVNKLFYRGYEEEVVIILYKKIDNYIGIKAR